MKTLSRRSFQEKERINLRLSPELFAAIDEARRRRPGNISRNTWIAEAIEEKLEREAKARRSERGDADA